MLNLTIKTPDLPENPSFIELIKSIIIKKFSRTKNLHSLTVVVSRSEDKRVPFTTEMELIDCNHKSYFSKAASVNTLSAVSQALARIERQIDKQRA